MGDEHERVKPAPTQTGTPYYSLELAIFGEGGVGVDGVYFEGGPGNVRIRTTEDPDFSARAGFGGEGCLVVDSFNNVNVDTGAFSGLGGRICGAYVRHHDGGQDVRVGVGLNILLTDARLVVAPLLSVRNRERPDGEVETSGGVDIGLKYFLRTYEEGPQGWRPFFSLIPGFHYGEGGLGLGVGLGIGVQYNLDGIFNTFR